MRRIFALLALLSLTGAVGAREKLRIGAWNVEWLGRPEMRSRSSRDVAQSPEDISAYLESSGVDLISLEEICIDPEREFARVNPTLEKALILLSERTGKKWKYALFPKKGGEATQLTGIAWNTSRVRAVSATWKVPLETFSPDGLDLWKRAPHAMKFQVAPGKTDFVVIPLHMKSNHRDDPRDNPKKHRQQEALALVKALPAVRSHFGERDLILMGDTNVLNSREPAILALVAGGLRNLNAADCPTTWKGPAPFDRIFLATGQPEFEHSVQRVYKPDAMSAEDFKVRLSDHYMVTTEIEVGEDDD